MNPATGTFITQDTYPGTIFDPTSLHKYLYANANPVTYCYPTGYAGLADTMTASAGFSILDVAEATYNATCIAIGLKIISNLRQITNQTSFNYVVQEAISELIINTVTLAVKTTQQIENWIITTAFPAVVYFSMASLKSVADKVSDVKAKLPNLKMKVYQLAYISVHDALIRLPKKYSYKEAVALLGVTGAINITLDSGLLYDKERSSDAQRTLQSQPLIKEKRDWGIYTHNQIYAKALAVIFSGTNEPEVHGSGMYGHYHDGNHAFHVWYGGVIT